MVVKDVAVFTFAKKVYFSSDLLKYLNSYEKLAKLKKKSFLYLYFGDKLDVWKKVSSYEYLSSNRVTPDFVSSPLGIVKLVDYINSQRSFSSEKINEFIKENNVEMPNQNLSEFSKIIGAEIYLRERFKSKKISFTGMRSYIDGILANFKHELHL